MIFSNIFITLTFLSIAQQCPLQQADGLRKKDLAEIGQIRDKCVFLVPDDEDYMNMEEPNYDDFMDFRYCIILPSLLFFVLHIFSELQVTSSLLSAALEAEAPPPYSEIDPNSSN